jgi:ParB family chromosome partitioning protein
MSDVQKHQAQKGKGLGRGLGSLLGGGDDGAFGKTANDGQKVLEKLVEKAVETPRPAPTASAQPLPQVATPPTAAVIAPVIASAVEAAPAAAPVASIPAVPNHLRIWQIPIEKIDANPNQPRRHFEKEALDELALSILEKGIIQPILVRKAGPDKFEIIAGERRWRASQLAGLHEIPSIIKDSDEREVLELALIENIQRENLNVIEEAEAYDMLIKKYDLTQQDMADKVGKDRATIANVLRLLQLQPEVRKMVSANELSLGQAKVLLGVGEPKTQIKLAKKTKDESLSVRALEKLVAGS